MLINSLFLSKLLGPKTAKQTPETDENVFSYLFSEIIKIKNGVESLNSTFENIGGSLLDHKTVFLSNSSPLENISLNKFNSSVKIIEELYKLFTSENSETKIDSENLLPGMNKIIADKAQFIKSIETLISNIFNETDFQNKEIEVRYVSKNLIETKKVNKENLTHFSEFLSRLIDGNQSFSFVLGANSKQILFDVENLSAVEDQKKAEADSITLTGLSKELQSTDSENVQFNNQKYSETGGKKDISIINLVDKYPSSEYQSDNKSNQFISTNGEIEKSTFDVSNKLERSISFSIGENASDNSNRKIVNNVSVPTSDQLNENANSNPVIGNHSDQIDNIQNKNVSVVDYSSNKNISVKATVNINHQESTTEKASSNNTQSFDQGIKIAVEGETEVQQSYPSLKNYKPEISYEELGEVKIVIKEKTAFNDLRNVNQIKFKPSHHKDLISNNFIEELTAKSETQNLSSSKLDKDINSSGNNLTMKSEEHFPNIINNQPDEPRISKAGLPLIADYQDWDLVFEKDSEPAGNTFENKNTNMRLTFDKESFNKLQMRKLTGSQNHNELKFNQEDPDLKIKLDKQTTEIKNKISENVKVEVEEIRQQENLLHLKFSGEKKIVSVSDIAQEDVIIFSNEVEPENNLEQNKSTITNSNLIPNSTETFDKKNSSETKPFIEQGIKPQKSVTNHDESFENKFQGKNESKKFSTEKENVRVNENKPDENPFKSEIVNSGKQIIQSEIKSHLFNNKSIIEHFIKNPAEARTLERFLEIFEKQEIIQRSEIINYSKQSHSVEIKIKPEELGSIKVLLDTNDNNVTAKIEVGNEQTKAIVVNNLPQLKETLSQQGVNLHNVNVTVSSEEQRNSEQAKQKSKKKSQNSNPKIDITAEKKTVRNLGYNTYEYLA